MTTNEGALTPSTAGSSAELLRTTQGLWGSKGSADTTGFSGQKEVIKFAVPASRPYGGWFDEVVDIIIELAEAAGYSESEVIEKVVVEHDQLVIFIRPEHLVEVATWCRDDQDLRFEMCLGVTGIHYPNDKGRELHGYFPLFSITHNRMIALECTAPDANPHMPSLVPVYPGDDWPEREAFDLMGIIFDGHPALTRSVMPDDWVGHPQRKDYPLGGIAVEYKGAVIPPPDTRRDYN